MNSNKLTVYDPVGGNKDIIYTLDSQQDQITNNTNSINAINTKLNTTVVTNTVLSTTLLGYPPFNVLYNYPTKTALDQELTNYATKSLVSNSLNDYVKTTMLF